MRTPPEPSTLVRVEWEDCYIEDAWSPVAELLTRTPCLMETVGWFLGKADTNWVVASGLDSKGNAGATWFIPEVLVRNWVTLAVIND